MGDLYKIMIVDDEFLVCDGLMTFQWNELGFEAVCSASNGEEALERMEASQADVVLTDIKMPFVDGLELSKRLSSDYPHIKIVLLTGYKEFDYAKKAISAGISEYLLKPVNLQELKSLFLRLKKELDERKKIPALINSYKKQINESLPLAAENFLKGILEERIYDYAEIEEKINLLELNLTYDYFACMILQADSISELWKQPGMRNCVHDLFSEICRHLKINNLGYAYISRNYEFIILLNFNLPDKFETPYEFIIHQSEEISGIVRRHSGSLPVRSSRISTGNIYKSILFAASSYKQAEISLKRKFFDESQEFFYAWKDKSSLINAFFEYPYESENQLLNALMEGDAKKSASGFRAFWEAFDPALRHLEPETIQNYALQLLNIIDRRLSKHKTSLGEIINIYPPFLSFINAFRSHNELEIALSGVISRVAAGLGSLNSKSRSSSYPCILKAKKFIEEHYNEKITLNQTAESVFLNPSYFSILFKKETGSNFVDYLKEFRITKAIELLNRVDLKIYEIGRLVGYEDPTYFTNTFKNFTGITPLEYKRKLPGE